MAAIPFWQRLLALLPYLLPWSDGLPFGRSLYSLFPALQWLSLPALPLVVLQQGVPFGGFLLFLVLFLAVVRNPQVPYLIRFSVLQAILIDILLVLVSLPEHRYRRSQLNVHQRQQWYLQEHQLK